MNQTQLLTALIILVLNAGHFLSAQASPETIARSSDSGHPRLFFNLDELPELRAKANREPSKQYMQVIRSLAEEYMELPTEPYADDTVYTGRNLQSHVANLAFIGWIDSDMTRIEKAKEVLLAAVRRFSLEDYLGWNGHLSTADAAIAIAIGYDWLAPFLTEAERKEVLAEIDGYGASLLEKSVMKPTRGPMSPTGAMDPSRLLHNHGVVYHSGLYFAGLLNDRQNWIDHALMRIRGNLFYFQDGTGAPYEGIGYANYGLEVASVVNEAQLHSGGKDLTRGVTGLREFSRFILHHTVPQGGKIVPQNQTGATFLDLAGAYYLANHLQDQLGLHAWQKLILDDETFKKPQTPHTSHLRMLPFLVLWTNEGLEPISPTAADEPTYAHFYRGMTAARGSWEEDDTALMTFQSGRRSLGGWDHSDENSFTFTAYGTNFLLDPAHSFRNGEHHGVVLINGRSQLPGGGGLFVEGFPLAAEDRGQSIYVAGDAADAYRNGPMRQEKGLPVEKAIRQLLFVPNAPTPYLVVYDEIQFEADMPENEFTWRGVYSDRYNQNHLEIADDEPSAIIRSGQDEAVAQVTFLHPSKLKLASTPVRDPSGRLAIGCLDAASTQTNVGRFLTVVSAAPSDDQLPQIRHRTLSSGIQISITHDSGRTDIVEVNTEDIRLLDNRSR